MLKHGILGLLNYEDMTGYDIMKFFKDSLSFFWTAQTSQIYRELQTLKKKGWVIDKNVTKKNKLNKKIFSITEKGKNELRRWLSEEDTGFEKRCSILMKTFFRGEKSIEQNIEFFKNVKKDSKGIISDKQVPLENVENYSKRMKDPKIAIYWKMTIEYGVMYMNMLNEWSNKCISELEELKNEEMD